MSIKVISMIWILEAEPDEKLVLLAYADHAHDDGTSIYPAVSTVAKMTGYSERSVQYITRKLEKKGLLVYDGRAHRANQWHIPLDEMGAKIAPIEGVSMVQSTTGKVQSTTRKVQSVQGKVQPIAPEPLLTVNKPLINREISSFEKPLPSKEETSELINTSKTKGQPALTREEVNKIFEEELRLNIGGREWDGLAALCLARGKTATRSFIEYWKDNGGEPRYWTSRKMEALFPQAFDRVTIPPIELAETPALDKLAEDSAHKWATSLLPYP
jgi:hypothetical protein